MVSSLGPFVGRLAALRVALLLLRATGVPPPQGDERRDEHGADGEVWIRHVSTYPECRETKRSGSVRRGEAVSHGPADGLAARANPDLPIEVAYVGLERVRAQHEPFGDLRVRESLGDQGEDLDLPL